MATFPPRVFGYRPCLCDHATHVRRAKKWRHNAKQAYLKMMSLPLVHEAVMVDFKREKLLFQKKKALQDLPPTPEQFKPKSPVSSIKVRKRKKRRGVHWGETSTRVVRTSYTRYFGD